MTGSGNALMVGDLNFHLDRKAYNITQKFTDMLGSLGIEQHVNKPTHVWTYTGCYHVSRHRYSCTGGPGG